MSRNGAALLAIFVGLIAVPLLGYAWGIPPWGAGNVVAAVLMFYLNTSPAERDRR